MEKFWGMNMPGVFQKDKIVQKSNGDDSQITDLKKKRSSRQLQSFSLGNGIAELPFTEKERLSVLL